MSAPVFDAHVAVRCGNTLGEGILWDDREQRLYWVDIDKAEVHTFDPKTGTHGAAHYGESGFVSALAPRVSAPGLVAATEAAVVLIDAPEPRKDGDVVEAKSVETVATPLDPQFVRDHLVRFNDGACDARGRFLIGSMTRPELRDDRERGELWRIGPNGDPTRLLENIGTSNGIDWSPDNKLMYYIDSNEGRVTMFDYDLETGTPSNRRLFAMPTPRLDGGKATGLFDGLVVDGVGNVWVARWGDARVVVYSPNGTLLASVRTPGALSPTIPCFGGKDLTTMYAATADANLAGQGDVRAQYPESGNVFAIDCGPGTPLGDALGPDWKGRVRHRFGG